MYRVYVGTKVDIFKMPLPTKTTKWYRYDYKMVQVYRSLMPI